ncbi:hypothetical protein Hanom_Chr08g00732371 [Helianthus anomalus]
MCSLTVERVHAAEVSAGLAQHFVNLHGVTNCFLLKNEGGTPCLYDAYHSY